MLPEAARLLGRHQAPLPQILGESLSLRPSHTLVLVLSYTAGPQTGPLGVLEDTFRVTPRCSKRRMSAPAKPPAGSGARAASPRSWSVEEDTPPPALPAETASCCRPWTWPDARGP